MAKEDRLSTLEQLCKLGVLTPEEFNAELGVLTADALDTPAIAPGTEGVLAAATGLSLTALRALAAEAPGLYRRHPIPKSKGGVRWLCVPSERLKSVQRSILDRLLYQLKPHPCAHGFVPGRSVLTHARHHTKKRWVVGLDIRRFFDETNEAAAASVFGRLCGVSAEEVELLCKLCCLDDGLPQGAPTSPCIANLYFEPADVALLAYAKGHGLRYSRYADDLALSGAKVPEDLFDTVATICASLGYTLVDSKTRVLGSGMRQVVTGLVVNQGLSAPRSLRRRLRAILDSARREGLLTALERAEMSEDRLSGLISWIALSDAALGQRLRSELNAMGPVTP